MRSRAVQATVQSTVVWCDVEGQWAAVKRGSIVLFYNEGKIEVRSR